MSLKRTSDSIYSEYLEAQHRESIEQAEVEKVRAQNDPTANRKKKKEIKLNEYELNILKQAATMSGATLSTFIRMAALKESKRVLDTA